ncbi:MAG: hypothetical protein V8R39_07755 [Clostridia bacterium]
MGNNNSIINLNIINDQWRDILSIHGDEKTKNNQKIGVIMDDSFLAKDWNMELVNQAMKVGYDKWDSKLEFSF